MAGDATAGRVTHGARFVTIPRGLRRAPRSGATAAAALREVVTSARRSGASARLASPPMLAHVTTFALQGVESRRVTVEVDLRPGLPAFTIVGLGDRAVREARERVRAAILNSSFEFPARRITVNLAPAYLRKEGPGFDLAIACGILAASAQLPVAALERAAVFGELALGGELRPCRGVLAVAEGAARAGLSGLLLEAGGAEAAAIAGELAIHGA